MPVQKVLVVNEVKHPVHAALQGTAKAELTETTGRRWSATFAPQPDPVGGGDAWAALISVRPAVVDLVGGDSLPEGFLVLETNLLPNSPPGVSGAGGDNFMETFEGVHLRLPIRDGFVAPTALSVPMVKHTNGEFAGQYVIKVTVKRAAPGTSNNFVSMVGHFTD
jgi:hypothetical protein